MHLTSRKEVLLYLQRFLVLGSLKDATCMFIVHSSPVYRKLTCQGRWSHHQRSKLHK